MYKTDIKPFALRSSNKKIYGNKFGFSTPFYSKKFSKPNQKILDCSAVRTLY